MRLLTRAGRSVVVAVAAGLMLASCGDGTVETGQEGPTPTPVSNPDGQSDEDLEQRLGDDERLDGLLGSLGDPAALARLELTLEPAESEVPLGGLIGVQAVLTNPTDEEIEVAALLDPVVPATSYAVRGPGREAATFEPPRIDEGFATPQPLPPGASVAYVVPLYLETSGPTVTEPGTFDVVASFPHVEPATTSIVIDPIDDEAERRTMTSPDVLQFVFDGGGERLAEARQQLEEISEGEGALAPYATYALLRYWLQPGRDFDSGAVREPDLDIALDLLDRARGQELGPVWLAHALITGLDSATANDDRELGSTLFDLLDADFSDVPAAATAVERYENVYR